MMTHGRRAVGPKFEVIVSGQSGVGDGKRGEPNQTLVPLRIPYD